MLLGNSLLCRDSVLHEDPNSPNHFTQVWERQNGYSVPSSQISNLKDIVRSMSSVNSCWCYSSCGQMHCDEFINTLSLDSTS